MVRSNWTLPNSYFCLMRVSVVSCRHSKYTITLWVKVIILSFFSNENVNMLFSLIHSNGTQGDDEQSWLLQN